MEEIFDLLSNTADGVCAVDQEQRIVFWNEAAEKLLGFKAEEVLGRSCSEVIGGRDEAGRLVCHRSCRDLMMALQQELVPTHDLLVRAKDGQEVWVSVSTILVPSRRKDLFVLAHLFRNVSRQKEVERLVQQLFSMVGKLPSFERTSLLRDPPLSPPSIDLTCREQEVLRLLASGASTQAIAEKLFISPSTVRNHIHSILAKLRVHSRLEAVTLALRSGLIS